MDSGEKKKLEELLERIEKRHAAAGEAIADLRALVAAEPGAGAQIKTLFGLWGEKWRGKYREAYVFTNNAATAANWRRLLKAMPVDEIGRRMDGFLEARDPFYANARHPVEMFVKAINKFGSSASEDEQFLTAPVIGCAHRPACRSDQQHTSRVTRELRGEPVL